MKTVEVPVREMDALIERLNHQISITAGADKQTQETLRRWKRGESAADLLPALT